MSEVTAPQAADIVNVARMTIYRHVTAGVLPARRVGLSRDIMVDIDDLRRYADKLGYRFDEALATQYAK